jgi:long-chain acyl-CoA synthetase
VRVTLAPGPNPFLYLQANADASPDAVFAQSPDQVLTNAEAVVYAKKVAYEMRRLGVKAGDVVALDLPDMLSIVFTEAVYHEGGVSTVLPDGFVADGAFRVDWIFSRKTPTPQKNARVVMVDLRFLQQVDQNPYGITPSEVPIDILRIVLSSGTTGAPKAIAMGRDMELAMDAALASWFRSGPHLVLMDIGKARGIGELFLSVKGRRPFLSVGGATPAEIARVARQNSVKSVKGSPAQLVGLVDELEASGRTLPSIEKVYFSGTSMPPGLASRIRQVTEGCTVFSNYGSTEVGGIAVREYNSDDPFDAGKVSPGALLEIVDDDDVALPCGVCRSLAVFFDRSVSLVADDEDAGCGFDYVVGDGVELVDLQYTVDLGEESFEESEVAAGDAFDGGDRLRVGEVVRVEDLAESFPMAVEDEQEFFASEGPVMV